jgi:hypothetical protein
VPAPGPCMEVRTARELLGFPRDVPLVPDEMARGLKVTFYPISSASDRVRRFTERLRAALVEAGVHVVPFDEARDPRRPDRLRDDLVIVAAGESPMGDLPIDHVSNLRKTSIVGIVDGPCPAEAGTTDQSKLNSIVRTLGWYVIQTVVYVDDSFWTICTMNGAIIPCSLNSHIGEDVRSILIPKLAAPVVPPHASDFEMRPGALDLSRADLGPYIDDFVSSGPLWEKSSLFLFHTSLEALEFRSPFYKRIVAAYLDQRSGMSYGFLARQCAADVRPAREIDRQDAGPLDDDEVLVRLGARQFGVRIPDAWVFTTRSGCDKAHLDPRRDILLMGLSRGRVIIETPKDLDPHVDSRPSYDTLTILAHAVGNAIVASLLAVQRPASPFVQSLRTGGLALAHWHGYVDPHTLPEGYAIYGSDNPPVSCSTHQAALFALLGKVSALRAMIGRDEEFRGDLHVEPHHGVNMTGLSLVDLARWVLQNVSPR